MASFAFCIVLSIEMAAQHGAKVLSVEDKSLNSPAENSQFDTERKTDDSNELPAASTDQDCLA